MAKFAVVEAWMLGRHKLPDELHPALNGHSWELGDIVVKEQGNVTVMRQAEFLREFEWVLNIDDAPL